MGIDILGIDILGIDILALPQTIDHYAGLTSDPGVTSSGHGPVPYFRGD